MHRWYSFGIFLSFVSLLGACEPDAQSESPKRGAPPAVVVVAPLKKERFVEQRSFFGEVRATSDASLSPAESGRVTKVHVIEGAVVKRGQVLVELDDHLARAQLSEAVAMGKQTAVQKKQAELEVERYQAMQKELVVSELEAIRKESEAQTLDAAAASHSARVQAESERLRRHRIVAPFDGTVTRRTVDPGDWLNPGEVALQLVTAGHVEVDVRVPARVLDARENITAIAIVEGKWSVPARVDTAVNALDPATRTALFRVTPLEEAAFLRAGASVQVRFEIERTEGLSIARDAIVQGVAGARIFIEEDGKARSIDVHPLAVSGDLILVEAPELQLGAKIVIRGNERLRPGQPLRTEGAMVPPNTAADSPPAPAKQVAPAETGGEAAP